MSVLPEPVGARISVCSPDAMAGQPCSWAWVGAAKEVSNQSLTGGENRSSAAMAAAYGSGLTAGPGGGHPAEAHQPPVVVVFSVVVPAPGRSQALVRASWSADSLAVSPPSANPPER